MLRFVFWDCDNTLIENGDLHWRKHKETLARYGYMLPEKLRKSFFHSNAQQNWQWMVEHINLTIPCDEYLHEVDTWYHAHIHEIPLRAGVHWALNHFKGNGIKQCVVTNARRASVEPMLHVQKIMPYFEFTWCKEDYTARKPNPMPYETSLQKMGSLLGLSMDKADCLAIEDDPLGVTSAHLAGIKVLQRRCTREELPSPDADISLFDENEFIKAIKDLFDT